MELSYYAFAFFIFILVCVVMLLGKFLYSDVKRQNKLLDEKETKLLRLYQTIEDSMDEFFDQVGEAKSEIKALGTLHLPQTDAEPISLPLPQGAAGEGRDKPSLFETPRFKRILDELADGDVDLPPQTPPKPPAGSAAQPQSRNEAVLSLWSEGKEKTQIAEELGITITEVELVLGLNGDTNPEARKNP